MSTIGLDENKIRRYTKYQEEREKKEEEDQQGFGLFLKVTCYVSRLFKSSKYSIKFMAYFKMVNTGAAFASTIAYIVTALVVIGDFTKISHKSWGEILIIKKTDFHGYKNFIYKIRKRILKSIFAYFGNIRTLFPVTSGQHSGIIRTPCRIIK